MKIIYFLLAMICMHAGASAQEILGTITDSTREPILYASVAVTQGGILKGGTITDIDGNYSVKPLEPGYYNVTASYKGYRTTTTTRVIVSPGEGTRLNFTLKLAAKGDTTTVIRNYRKLLIDPYKNSSSTPCGEWPVRRNTTQGVDLVAPTPGIYDRKRDTCLADTALQLTNIKAHHHKRKRKIFARQRNIYLIDGIEVKGAPAIATWGAHGAPHFRKISIRKLRYRHYVTREARKFARNNAKVKLGKQ